MMSEYEIGRDLQDLRSRIEALEGGGHGHAAQRVAAGRMAEFSVAPGISREKPPVVWKPKKDVHLPPFLNRRLGFPPGLKLEAPETQTWTCTPEPLIVTVKLGRRGNG
jgi:hypothetical protein